MDAFSTQSGQYDPSPHDTSLQLLSDLFDKEAAVDRQVAGGVDEFYHALLDQLDTDDRVWVLEVLHRHQVSEQESTASGRVPPRPIW